MNVHNPDLVLINGDIVDLSKSVVSSNSDGENFVNGIKVSNGSKLKMMGVALVHEDEIKGQIKPTVIELARSASDAAVKLGKSGFKKATQEEIEKRLGICHSCSHLDRFGRCVHIELKDGKIKKGCGCFMSKKTAYSSMNCPQGKW